MKSVMKSIINNIYVKYLLISFLLSTVCSCIFISVDGGDLSDVIEVTLYFWLVISIPSLLFITLYKFLSSGLKEDTYINTPHKDALNALLKQLRLRSKMLRGISILALLMTGCCIFIGVYIFVSASLYSKTAGVYLTERAYSGFSDSKYRLEYLEQVETKINVYGIDKYLELFPEEAYSVLNLRPQKPTSQRVTDKEKNEYLESLDSFKTTFSDSTRVSAIKSEIQGMIKKAQENLDKESQNISENELDPDESEDIYFIISTTITRFGTILLILFLVRILLELYRYCVKLASFYDARADSIQLSAKDTAEDLILSLVFFSADNIDFKNQIEGPFDKIISLAENIALKQPMSGDKK